MTNRMNTEEPMVAEMRPPMENDGRPVGTQPHDAVFLPHDLEDFRRRWREIQTSFVDEPRESVQRADELVGTVIDRLTDAFSKERSRLDRELTGDTTTENLRQALRQYRWFFDRLLSM